MSRRRSFGTAEGASIIGALGAGLRVVKWKPIGAALIGISGWVGGIAALDRAFPPDLDRAADVARVLLDRDGEPLRYLLARDDRLRLAVAPAAVDSRLATLLVAYEDRRFWSHPGVDPLALARALAQWVWHGRPISGASTLTMQTARLLEPRPRTVRAKLVEMARALQLERRLSKREILGLYLRVAPYGGNLEGAVAASRYYFGKAPRQLTLGEVALLVALPQSPTRLRPDRHPEAAIAARAKVLDRVWPRVAPILGLAETERALARGEPLSLRGHGLPLDAPHLADRLLRGASGRSPGAGAPAGAVRSCIDGPLQRRLAASLRNAVRTLHPRASIAALVVDNTSAEVHAYLGGADYLSTARAGQLDLVRAIRSPGSTLKPLIYGLAFETGLAAPATQVDDVPTRFGRYLPANFEGRYRGTVSLAEALRLSLNVPAVALLAKLGPARFTATLGRHGVPLRLPDMTRPGLAVALGGAGTSLEDLVRLYRAIGDDGVVRPLGLRCDAEPAARPATPILLGAEARWHVARILRDVAAPAGRRSGPSAGIAYKTGTSYGFRDAWSIGFDRHWTVGVWVGRPDGTPVPGAHGHAVAAPVLFEIFGHLPASEDPAPPDPTGAALAWDPARLPPGLRHLGAGRASGGPRFLFPLPDTRLMRGRNSLPLEALGGVPPYTWLIDGRPVQRSSGPRAQWRPVGPGFVLATVVDGAGRSDRVRFRIAESSMPVVGRLRSLAPTPATPRP